MTSKLFTATALAAALFAGLAAAPAMAQNTHTPSIDNAQQAVHARIQQGLQSGHITPSEAQALYRRDRDIQNREAFFKSDGRATPQERQQLRADMANLSAEVERMMNNRDVVGQHGQGSATPGIDNSQREISQRINDGLRSGRISQREARMLHGRERAIERREAAFKSDGVVTPQERRQLRDELSALRNQVERLINPRG
ncbi:hypothetical protein [Polaromonas sp. SM01]|uniref:hypothetical protein n=1 Tax=Polaromonas sp. SM01 TaxID=3085630 RepID=UPI00298157EA|nr:hypothetical protein [Polaromonas sp. SM01]MDW5443395.1 hypothetical protein [Polaromonas sp. SM01]